MPPLAPAGAPLPPYVPPLASVPPTGPRPYVPPFAPMTPAAVLRPPPPPRPPIIPERVAAGWKTPHLLLSRPDERGDCYVDYEQQGATHRVYLSAAHMRRLVSLATSQQVDAGAVWKKFSELPLTRPLPSRQLDEELRLLIVASLKG